MITSIGDDFDRWLDGMRRKTFESERKGCVFLRERERERERESLFGCVVLFKQQFSLFK